MSTPATENEESIDLDRVRNIGIMAHIDAGKTTVAERMLYYTGRTHRMGSVDDGNATMDWMDQERERGITIASAATTTYWRDHRINLIDTPGHVDFTVEVERSLRVLDGVIALFCGVGGVEPQSEVVWHQKEKYDVPAIAFINKMDRVGADFERVVNEIEDRLAAHPVPIIVPLYENTEFIGIIDLIAEKRVYYNHEDLGETYHEEPVTPEDSPIYATWRDHLIQSVSDQDEELFEKYCLNQPIEPAEIRKALRQSTLAGKSVPVLCGSALKNKGVQRLMDCVVDYLPSPKDLPPVIGFCDKNKEEVERYHNSNDELAALAFKVVTDQHVGKMVYLRVYSGKFEVGSYVYNATKEKTQRVSRLMLMHADHREQRDALYCGEIGVAVGLKDTTTGDSLSTEDSPVILENIEFPAPVLSVSVSPPSAAERDKLLDALGRLSEEDPTFTVKYNDETDETIISGMGQLHLEILIERLKREFKVQPEVGEPRVAYRETITQPAEIDHKLVKQTGGHGQYAHVVLKLEPLAPGEGFEFSDDIRGGNVPKEYIPAVERGVVKAMAEGAHAGTPVVDLAVRLEDGSYHEVDSSEMAFHKCAHDAFNRAFQRGNPKLLEPVSSLNVITPEEHSGAVTGSICSRRGRITGIESRSGTDTQLVQAIAPLAEMFGYATELRSITAGRGNFDMRFERYERVPDHIAEEILEEKHAEDSEES